MLTSGPQPYFAPYCISHINTFGKKQRGQTITHFLYTFVLHLTCLKRPEMHYLVNYRLQLRITSVPYATTENNKFQVDKDAIGLLSVQQFVIYESDQIYTSIIAFTPALADLFHSFIVFCETGQKDKNYTTEPPVILD